MSFEKEIIDMIRDHMIKRLELTIEALEDSSLTKEDVKFILLKNLLRLKNERSLNDENF